MSSSYSATRRPTSDSETEKDAAYLKRREQVRRAQRNHRERKENYIKALEDELFQLRSRERELAQKNEVLSNELAQLKSLVGRNEQWNTETPFIDSMSDISGMPYAYGNALFGVEWQTLNLGAGTQACSITSMEGYIGPTCTR